MNTNNRFAFDVEVFPNFFCVTFLNIDTDTKEIFIIWKERDDRDALVDFLNKKPFLISYIGLS